MHILAWFNVLFLMGIMCVVWVEGWYRWISWVARRYCMTRVEDMQFCPHALVLGTRPRVNRKWNPYLLYRLQAASALLQAKKVERLILSGSHFWGQGDQTTDMKAWCLENGIYPDQILVDEHGKRTWQSIRHCQQAGIRHLSIVSQHFHNERAVYIARYMGMRVQALDATDVQGLIRYRILLRERLARVRMFIDIILDQYRKYVVKI
jgi:SanA protein